MLYYYIFNIQYICVYIHTYVYIKAYMNVYLYTFIYVNIYIRYTTKPLYYRVKNGRITKAKLKDLNLLFALQPIGELLALHPP